MKSIFPANVVLALVLALWLCGCGCHCDFAHKLPCVVQKQGGCEAQQPTKRSSRARRKSLSAVQSRARGKSTIARHWATVMPEYDCVLKLSKLRQQWCCWNPTLKWQDVPKTSCRCGRAGSPSLEKRHASQPTPPSWAAVRLVQACASVGSYQARVWLLDDASASFTSPMPPSSVGVTMSVTGATSPEWDLRKPHWILELH